jgi:hypothetical protein
MKKALSHQENKNHLLDWVQREKTLILVDQGNGGVDANLKTNC